MIIAFDVDDVLVNTHPYLLDHLNNKFNTHFTRSDATMYYIQELWGERKEEADKEINKYFETEGEYLPAVQFAKEVVNFFVSKGDRVIAVTAREEMEELTKRCLDREFEGNIDKVFFAGLSGQKRETKYQVLCRENVGFYVDDRSDFVLQCNGHPRKVLLYNQKWNEKDIMPDTVGRVSNWDEILKERIKLGF